MVVSAPAAQASPAASALGCTGCSVAQLLWLLWLPARLLRLSACPLWLLAFIPYAKVKKLILTHYILFICKDRCMFFSDAAFPSRMLFSLFPMDLPGSSIFATAQPLAAAPQPAALPRLRLSAVAPPRRPGQHLRLSAPASNIFPMALRHGASASKKPHRHPRPATNLIRRRRVLRFG